MAPPPGTLRVGRYLFALVALLAVLYAVAFFPGKKHTPKLGIDLVGGLRVLFTAQVPAGSPQPTSSQMNQARQILENRINTTGVTGATVVVQGNNQLVVEIPSGTSTDVARLGKAAVLNFRGLIAPGQPIACAPPGGAGTAANSPGATSPAPATSGSKAPKDAGHRPLAAPKTTPKSTPSGAKTPAAATSPAASPSPTGTAATPTCLADPITPLFKSDPTLKSKMPNAETCPSPSMPEVNGKTAPCRAYSALSSTQQQELASALQRFDCTAGQVERDDPANYYIACDNTGAVAYLLGHVVVQGKHIKSAAAQAPSVGGQGGSTQWTVRLELDGTGADNWHAWTSKYNTTDETVSDVATDQSACSATGTVPCSTFVGFTLDGQVISLPRTEAVLDTTTSVSGNFTQSSANDLARELNYGKLPISFHVERNDKVSATLGSKQLHGAFLAGGIGLALVVLYSLIYYRGLGTVTIASLIVSAGLTYAMLVILGRQIGFNLDLAGIAGFIVALGITADSFVVFFERIKDEVHEGRSLRVAVPRAWVRARRTILSADTVSFLAAAILYFFAAADVQGFAFTLGMSTILDLVVVFLFTHPMVSLLSRSKAFGSPRFTGLNHVRIGGIAAASDDDAPAPRRRPRRTRPARPAAAEEEPSAVAVLDADEEPETGEPGTTGTGAAEAEPGTAEPEPADEARGQRRRTAPAPGTAAERAAARRAKMRRDAEGKGDR